MIKEEMDTTVRKSYVWIEVWLGYEYCVKIVGETETNRQCIEERVINCDCFSTTAYIVVLCTMDVKTLSKDTAHNKVCLLKINYCNQWKWTIVHMFDYINKLGGR